jgi:hypothetical protein
VPSRQNFGVPATPRPCRMRKLFRGSAQVGARSCPFLANTKTCFDFSHDSSAHFRHHILHFIALFFGLALTLHSPSRWHQPLILQPWISHSFEPSLGLGLSPHLMYLKCPPISSCKAPWPCHSLKPLLYHSGAGQCDLGWSNPFVFVGKDFKRPIAYWTYTVSPRSHLTRAEVPWYIRGTINE